jgi:hypothetical protein
MKTGQKVKLFKIDHLDTACYSNQSAGEQTAGEFFMGLNIGYTAQGTLINEVVVGESLKLMRTHRNGVESAGVLNTSPVSEIESLDEATTQIKTDNSVYIIEQTS